MENRKKLNAFEAMSQAQILTFYPIVFQAIVASKRLGILEFLFINKGYHTPNEVSKEILISEYGVKILLDMLCKVDIVYRNINNQFMLSDVGYFILNDKQTSINLDFVQDVCYKGVFHLTDSIKKGKPSGLIELGNWDTLYEGLLELPEKVKESWFNFDHFYSDSIFNNLLKIVFLSNPESIMDIGGNTGRFAIEACKYSDSVKVTIVDLQKQLKLAKENISNAGINSRVDYFHQNMLEKKINLPKNKNIILMSQFLDCFSEEEIINILNNIINVSNKDTRILIIETFWDNQRFNAAEYCLLGLSLYFTSIANGNSRMYAENDFKDIISKTGFKVENQYQVGEYHTLLELRIK